MKEFNWHIIQDFKHVKLSGPLTALYMNQLVQQMAGGVTSAFFAVFYTNVYIHSSALHYIS